MEVIEDKIETPRSIPQKQDTVIENQFIQKQMMQAVEDKLQQQQQIKKYLDSSSVSTELKGRISKYQQTIQDKILCQINTSQLKVSPQKKQYPIKKEIDYQNEVQKINEKKKQIEGKKHQMVEQLRELEDIEQDLNRSRFINESQLHRSNIRTINYNFGETDDIKAIKRKRKIYKTKIQNQIKQFQLKKKQLKLQKEIEEQEIVESEKLKRREFSIANNQIIQKRIEERKHKKIEENHLISQLKKKKKLFQKMQIKAKKKQNNFEKTIQKHKSQKKKEYNQSFANIKDFEKQYDKKKEEIEKQRESRLRNSAVNEYDPSKFQSVFLNRVCSEDKQKKNEIKSKKKQISEQIKRKIQFSSKVREKAKMQLKINQIQEQEDVIKQALNIEERYHKGNEYMKLGNAHRKLSPVGLKVEPEKENKLEKSVKVDFLRQLRAQRKDRKLFDEENQMLKKVSEEALVQKDFTKILDYANKIKENPKKKSQHNVMKSVNFKLKVLEELHRL